MTCLVDLMRPSVGFAAVKLLEDAGCRVSVPESQTCCGQPAWNSGDRLSTNALLKQTIAAFESFDYVVAPSGSCAGMLRRHAWQALKDEPEWRERAKQLSSKTFELVSFITDVRGVTAVDVRWSARATYHDGCSGLRELGIHQQPRKLLSSILGLTLIELPDSDACCGFGGTFSVKYPEISNAIVEAKAAAVDQTGADLLIAGDLGCLFNIQGKLRRQGKTTAVRHVAEVLAGMQDVPAIGSGT